MKLLTIPGEQKTEGGLAQTAFRIMMPPILPSTVPSVSASATLLILWLNPPPHPITVYASHAPSPTTAQHSLPGGALPPYRGRSFTGRIASASPDAPEPEVRIHLPPAVSLRTLVPEEGYPLGAHTRYQRQSQSRRHHIHFIAVVSPRSVALLPPWRN